MGIYEQLGVRRVINAVGPFTMSGGSLMPREVVVAMSEAAEAFVDMDELLEKTGDHIAELIGAPAALVTSGAAAGMAVCVAACMGGDDAEKAAQLPDTEGMKDEVIVFRSHRIPYDQALRVTGARLIEMALTGTPTVQDIEAHTSAQTAAIFYVAKCEKKDGSVPLRDVIEFGRRQNIPVIVDAADELPPVGNLRKYIDMGAHAAVFSGGKGLEGPQGSGLVLGDKALIRACRAHACPHYGIGRAMKVDKEEIVGLTKAIELYLQRDFDAEMEAWQAQRDYIAEKLAGIANTTIIKDKPLAHGMPGSFYLPTVYIDLEKDFPLDKAQLVDRLWQGDPRIIVGESEMGIVIRVMQLKAGEERQVTERLLEIMQTATADAPSS